MATINHPTRFRPAPAPAPTFIVCLSFDNVAKGVAGPFTSEGDASAWVAALLGDEAGWDAAVLPLTEPGALPLAAERKEAKRRQRHLHVVR